jgi:hypothetical protein
MRALLAAAGLALLAGCSTSVDAPALPAADALSGSAPVAAGPESADADVELGGSCTGPGGLEVSYPVDWTAAGNGHAPGCSLFSAERFEVVPASDVRTAAIALRVEDVPFAEAAAVLPDEVARIDEVVDGRAAVRTEHVAGQGLWPEGTRSTRWVVDLGTTVVVADAVGLAVIDHPAAVDVLDAMVRTLDVDMTA